MADDQHAPMSRMKAEKKMSGECVITLVHGTWARKAPWTDESSVLCRGLKDQCPSSLLIFERFQWSGRNLFSARKTASNRLVAHMKQLIQTWPTARHYIIAHSHGGNIALYALRDNDVNRAVSGVVCLATPFLHARPRDLGPYGKDYLGAMTLSFFVTVCLIALAHWFPVLLSKWYDIVPNGPSKLFATVPLFLVVCYPARWLLTHWTKWGRRLLQDLSFPNLNTKQLLIVRTIGDEAQAALAGTQLIGWLSIRIWLPISTLAGKAENARGWRRMALSHVAAVLNFFAMLLLIPILGLVSIFMGAFAPDLILASPFIDMAIEATPQGSWVVHQLPSVSNRQLSHSQSYNDTRTVALIAEWLNTPGTALTTRPSA